jgi:hypothetical protein
LLPVAASELDYWVNQRETISNISYLLQHDRIEEYGSNGNTLLNIKESKDCCDSFKKEE